MPALIVVGARDAAFRAMGSEMSSTIGSHADLVEIPDAGHAVHLESPDVTAGAVNAWLDGLTER
jgi:pimeloyl-ACP methyl ester carboxylesterase